MRRPLAIHQLTAMELEPAEFVTLAADVGCAGVCMFTHGPRLLPYSFRTVSPANLAEFRARLARTGLTVVAVDHFPIMEGAELEEYAAGLALGGELGAHHATTAVHDTDAARAVERLGALADLAGGYGLQVAIEFMGLSAGCDSLEKAAWLVDQVGRDNLGICLDPLHLVRTGGTAAAVAALAPRYFTSVQMCDGHGTQRSADYAAECMDRQLPDDGDFPLREIFRATPGDTPLDLEVPTARYANDDPRFRDFLLAAVDRTHALLAEAPPAR